MGARSAEIFQIYQLIFLINSYQMGARSAENVLIYQLIFLNKFLSNGRAQRRNFFNLCVDTIPFRPRAKFFVQIKSDFRPRTRYRIWQNRIKKSDQETGSGYNPRFSAGRDPPRLPTPTSPPHSLTPTLPRTPAHVVAVDFNTPR